MADLERISREGGAHFEVVLEGAPTLHCEEVVRRIPGRRLVCRALWQGRSVFAKLFIGHEAARYAERDAAGVRALMDRGLPTPELLHKGDLATGQGRALILAFLEGSRNAEEAWSAGDTGQRRQLADRLVQAVAAHHAAGLVQTDMYPRNFLVAGDTLYTLDGDGIRVHPHGVARASALDNLAVLLSKFDVLDDLRIPERLVLYKEARRWDETVAPENMLQRVRRMRTRLARKFVLRKVLRDCTDIRVERSCERYFAAVRQEYDDDLRHIVEAPDSLLNDAGSMRLKNGHTCTVGLVQSGARRLVVKRYNIKDFRHGLGRAWRRSRASVAWSNAHLLRSFGIATPAPLALVERRWGPLQREAWLLTEFAEGANLREVLADPARSEAHKREVAAHVARLLYRLRLLRIEHGDMKANNIKWVDGTPMLLDLDAMKLHGCDAWFDRRHARDLRRFLKNWHNAPDILRIVKSALMQAYGRDPVLKRAGIDHTSETT
jgi:tRNA A-37 threonylcarbamoyl transferase component Bud32